MSEEYRLCILDEPSYEASLDTQARYLYQQTAAFAAVNRARGTKTDLLALFKGEEAVVVAKLVYYRWKKFFYSAEIHFGPLFRSDRPEQLDRFLTELLCYLRRNKRVLRLRIAPFVLRRIYHDFDDPEETEDGREVETIFKKHHFHLLEGDLFTDPSQQAHFYYVKDINGLDSEEVLAQCEGTVRYQMKVARRLGVRVRFLEAEELDIFDRMMEATMERTGSAVEPIRYHREAAQLYEASYFPVAYLPCEEALSKLAGQMEEVNISLSRLQQKMASHASSTRYEGQLKELQNQQAALQRRVKRIEEMQKKHGDIVYMAAAAFYASPSDMVYLQSAAYSEFMDFNPVYAIHETMIWEAVHLGCRNYNFFAVSGPQQEGASDAGVIAFKRQFRGNLEEILGTYEYRFYSPKRKK